MSTKAFASSTDLAAKEQTLEVVADGVYTLTFHDSLTIDLGGSRGELQLRFLGRGHTEGDIVGWLPAQRVLFAGDVVEARAALYTGDAFHFDWSSTTLDRAAALGAEHLI